MEFLTAIRFGVLHGFLIPLLNHHLFKSNIFMCVGSSISAGFWHNATTAKACANTNRNYIGFELDKNYYEIANERIEEHKAELETE